jgi:hypothetical protein
LQKNRGGGWHFSYLGGHEAIVQKIKSFSHQEYNNEKYVNDMLTQKVSKGKDLFGRVYYRYIVIDMDTHPYPKYILDNREKYADFISPDQPSSFVSAMRIMSAVLCALPYYIPKRVFRFFYIKSKRLFDR